MVQHNCLGSWDVFLSLFHNFILLPHPPLLVAIQDPPSRRSVLPTFPGFLSFTPPPPGLPRVAIYVSRVLNQHLSCSTVFHYSSEMLSVDVFLRKVSSDSPTTPSGSPRCTFFARIVLLTAPYHPSGFFPFFRILTLFWVTSTFTTRWQIPAAPSLRGNLSFRCPTGTPLLTVRREPISKSCGITQADNLNRRRRLSRKAQ